MLCSWVLWRPFLPSAVEQSSFRFRRTDKMKTVTVLDSELMEKFQADDISTRAGTHAIHMLNSFRKHYGFNETDCSDSLACSNHSVVIPQHNRIVAENYSYILFLN